MTDRQKRYYDKNREKIDARCKVWRSNNIEKSRVIINKSFAKWRSNNPERAKILSSQTTAKWIKSGKGKDYIRAYNKRVRDFVNEYKEKNQCMNPKCKYHGYQYASQLDFHHLEDKKFNIAACTNKSIKTINDEAKKCTLVCANCHRLITWNGLDATGFKRCKLVMPEA